MLPAIFARTEAVPGLPIPESYWVIPGRLLAGEYPGAFAVEITRRRMNAFLEAGFDTFINLTGEAEAEDYAVLLQEQASYYGQTVECRRFPINDYGLPAHPLMSEILDALDGALARGRKVYLHCRGGVGRTGTTVGCFLVRYGCGGEQALQTLSGWWQAVPKSARYQHSPETREQEMFVLGWNEKKN